MVVLFVGRMIAELQCSMLNARYLVRTRQEERAIYEISVLTLNNGATSTSECHNIKSARAVVSNFYVCTPNCVLYVE